MQVRPNADRSIPAPLKLAPENLVVFEAELSGLLRNAPAEIQLDCGQLVHVTSSYVKVFWRAYQLCQQAGARLRLIAPSPGLVRTLELLDLKDFFVIGAGEGEASAPAHMANTAGVYTDRFRADVAGIDAATDRFMRFLARVHVDPASEFELRTIFYEVATNIREHAQLRPGEEVLFSATASGEKLVLTFSDGGIPFDPTRRDARVDFVAAARRGQTCGFGIAMVNRMCDRMTYAREGGTTNVLMLEKKRGV